MLIDNKDALTAVDDCNYKIMSGYEWIRKQEIKKRLKELPSAERTGKQEMKSDPYGFFDEIPVCSECGCTTKMREKTNYCPNCGARMVSEDER